MTLVRISKYIKKEEHPLGPLNLEVETDLGVDVAIQKLSLAYEYLVKTKGTGATAPKEEPKKPIWHNPVTCAKSTIRFSDDMITVFRCPMQTFSPPTKDVPLIATRDMGPCDKCQQFEEKKVSHT
jgi:hypothetical protein